jgi:hypothetical protein
MASVGVAHCPALYHIYRQNCAVPRLTAADLARVDKSLFTGKRAGCSQARHAREWRRAVFFGLKRRTRGRLTGDGGHTVCKSGSRVAKCENKKGTPMIALYRTGGHISDEI